MYPPVVKACDELCDDDLVISPRDKVITVGGKTLRIRDVTSKTGARAFVQLPECYAPRGLLADFEGGALLEIRALDGASAAALAVFRAALIGVLDRALHGPRGGPVDPGSEATKPEAKHIPVTKHIPVSAEGRAVLRNRRADDVRGFRSLAVQAAQAPAEAALRRCRSNGERDVLAGEHILTIVSVEHVWTTEHKAGVQLRLHQYMLCDAPTDGCLFRGFAEQAAALPQSLTATEGGAERLAAVEKRQRSGGGGGGGAAGGGKSAASQERGPASHANFGALMQELAGRGTGFLKKVPTVKGAASSSNKGAAPPPPPPPPKGSS